MEIKNVQVVKPFGPLILVAQLPEGVIQKLNQIVDVIKDKKDMGSRLAGVIETESEIPHSMLEEKKVMDIFHALSRGYIEQAYKHGSGEPVVFYRSDHKPWIVMLGLQHYMDLLRDWKINEKKI